MSGLGNVGGRGFENADYVPTTFAAKAITTLKGKEELGEGVEKFSKKRMYTAGASSPKAIASKFKQLTHSLTPTSPDKTAAPLDKKFIHDLHEAELAHYDFDMGTAFAKKTVGKDNLLVHTRNVATRTVLRNQEDLNASKEIAQKLLKASDAEFKQLTGRERTELSKQALEKFANGELSATMHDGVCFATSIHLASKLIEKKKEKNNFSEETLVDLVKNYEKGVPAEAAGMQAIYQILDFADSNDSIIQAFHLVRNDYVQTDDAKLGSSLQKVLDKARENNEATDKAALTKNIRNNLEATLEEIEDKKKEITDAKTEQEKSKLEGELKDLEDEKASYETQINETLAKKPSDIKENSVPSLIRAICDKHGEVSSLNEDKLNALLDATLDKKDPLRNQIKDFLKNLSELDSEKQNILQKEIREMENNSVVTKLTGHGIMEVDVQGTTKANQIIGFFTDHDSSASQLVRFPLLPDGIYQPSIVTGKVDHALLYVKENGEGYFFDPNFGLIKCDGDNHADTFLKIMSMYTPPETRLEGEDKDKPNYRVTLFKIKPHETESGPKLNMVRG